VLVAILDRDAATRGTRLLGGSLSGAHGLCGALAGLGAEKILARQFIVLDGRLDALDHATGFFFLDRLRLPLKLCDLLLNLLVGLCHRFSEKS